MRQSTKFCLRVLLLGTCLAASAPAMAEPSLKVSIGPAEAAADSNVTPATLPAKRETPEVTLMSAPNALRLKPTVDNLRTLGPNHNDDLLSDRASTTFAVSRTFLGDTDEDFQFSLSPRAKLTTSPFSRTASAGAEVRIGRALGLAPSSAPVAEREWYFFAGADGQAVTWHMNDDASFTDLFKLRDRMTIGDFQAGFSYDLYGANFAVSYLRREFKSELGSANADFAAVSLSYRH